MKRILLLSTVLLWAVSTAWAQQTVSGKVTSGEDGSSLPGVAIQIKGTGQGTTTNVNGEYTLQVPGPETVLVYSYYGFADQEQVVGNRNSINVVLRVEDEILDAVVVTAQGISREKASLGYSQQTLDAEAVNKVKESNFINSLSGKVAGVNVRTNNTMGGSTNITIRGNSSFTNNQPLFVIDGIPVSNETNNTAAQQSGQRGYDYGNPASDISPEDIASMSILKGAAATALYGSRGQNGVVLITTKKGSSKKGIGVNVTSGITVGRINKDTFIDYQDQYGAGYGRYYGSSGYFQDFQGEYVVPTTEDGSYGAAFNPNLLVYHWDSFVPESANFGQLRPYVAAQNTPVDFFETQKTLNNSVALSGGNENATYRLSYTNMDMEDILPNSSLNKHTVNFNGAVNLTEKLTSDVFFQYNKQNAVGRFSTGYSDNLMSQFRQWWQVNVDIQAQEDIYRQTGKNYTWNAADFEDPLTPIYWDNPYWTRYENYNSDGRDRILTKLGAAYKFNDWLTFNASVSVDEFTEIREERRAVGSVPTAFGVTGADQSSGYDRTTIQSAEYNYNGILTANKMLSDDLSVAGLLGFNLRKENYDFLRSSTSGGLASEGLYTLGNSLDPIPLPLQYLNEREVYGYFGNINLGYRDYLYLDGTYRVDVASTLPVENNVYDYYSVGLGFVFSELTDYDWLNFGKLRASYGIVGNDAQPRRVFDYYLRNNNFGSSVITTLPSIKNNPDLLPEETREYEFGLQAGVLKNRIELDFAYYNRVTSNQLLAVDVSRATGYSGKFVNAGAIENKGIEVVLSGDVVKTNDLRWNVATNFTRNRSKVLELDEENGITNYVFASYQGGITSNATVGQPFGVFRGTGFEYINGQRVVDGNGYYKAVADQVIGDPNPEYNLGINNSFSYKGISLSGLIDIQKGGDVYSLDMHYGQGTGLPNTTVGLNELGNPIRNTLANGGGIILPGVTEDGSPNTTRARADYYGGAFYWGNSSRNPAALTIYDGSYVKLRELAISYALPSKMIERFASKVEFSVVGRNLAILHKNVPFADPESGLGVGAAQGYISGAYPTVRTVGFKVEVGL